MVLGIITKSKYYSSTYLTLVVFSKYLCESHPYLGNESSAFLQFSRFLSFVVNLGSIVLAVKLVDPPAEKTKLMVSRAISISSLSISLFLYFSVSSTYLYLSIYLTYFCPLVSYFSSFFFLSACCISKIT
jgi:hypothetical protein